MSQENAYKYFAYAISSNVRERASTAIQEAKKEHSRGFKQFDSGRLLSLYWVSVLVEEAARACRISPVVLDTAWGDMQKQLCVASHLLAVSGSVGKEWSEELGRKRKEMAREKDVLVAGSVRHVKKIYHRFVCMLVDGMKEQLFSMRERERRAKDTALEDFVSGQVFGLNEIITVIQIDAERAFKISLEELKLTDTDMHI